MQSETQVSGSPTGAVNHLIDPQNHTGYAQVLEERDASLNTTMTYTLGLDVLTQGDNAGTPNVYHLMYDGHGSTRALLNASAATIAASYAYDAYGNAEGFTASSAATRHLYAGEQHDAHLGFYYLRARWYDAATGRCNRMDPYAGSSQDPQSLHKYLYAHANPVMGVDPSGLMSIISLSASLAIVAVIAALTFTTIGVVLDVLHGASALEIVSNALITFGSTILATMSAPFAIALLAAGTIALIIKASTVGLGRRDALQIGIFIFCRYCSLVSI